MLVCRLELCRRPEAVVYSVPATVKYLLVVSHSSHPLESGQSLQYGHAMASDFNQEKGKLFYTLHLHCAHCCLWRALFLEPVGLACW